MNLKQLSERAMQIQKKYSELQKKEGMPEWSRLNYMEGFVGDVGDLMKLVMAKEGVRSIENVDDKLAHELADCLWSVLVLAQKYNIDLEESFAKTMDELENRISMQ